MYISQYNISQILKKPFVSNIIQMLLYGFLSLIFGLVEFYIPGIEGAGSDFREIPLLIGVMHVSNPISLIGMSLITSLGTVKNGAFLSTFIAHSISLIISWYIYSYVQKKQLSITLSSILWMLYIVVYYLIILIPFLVIISQFIGLNKELSFDKYYTHYILATRFEILSTALITTLYLIQFHIKKELKKHKNKLEYLVKERTEELETANEELKSINEELYEKNEIIRNQNEELTTTLRNLKETQSQLIQAEKMASLGVLAAGVSHEINNPLNYIMGAYTGLKNFFNKNKLNDEEIDLFLHSIEVGVKRASEIVKSLNQISYDTGDMNEDCDINLIINNCLLITQNTTDNNIKIIKEFETTPLFVTGNNSNLQQAFINIFKNSLHAVKDKGFIKIVTKKSNNKAIIKFIDTGKGIKKEDIAKITEPFFTTKDPGEGTGLGLSITYSIIKNHNGEIEFVSEKNQGTTVTIELPLKQNFT